MTLLGLSKRAGPALLLQRAWQQVWLDKDFLCLRCDLSRLPDRLRAKVQTGMRPLDLADFDGFEREFELTRGADAVEVYARERLRQAGVETAYVARDPQDVPMYVQWLVTAETQARLHDFQPERYRRLEAEEALIEGAYTFTRFRGLGLMAASQYQLLELARERGVKRVWTYVGVDNAPSLKGCARTGFVPDHVRRNQRRLGSMRTEFTALTPAVSSFWNMTASTSAA